MRLLIQKSGVAEICYRKQEKGEIPPGDIIFVMVSGDGGLDIGMGSALGTALRGHRLLIFEYDNGGYKIPIPSDCVKEIIIGHNFDMKELDWVRQIAEKYDEYPPPL